MPKRISFRSVTLNLTSKHEVLTAIEGASASHPVRVATVNPEFVELASYRRDFAQALLTMTHATVDGHGLYMALKACAPQLNVERYTGADLFADLCTKYSDGSKRIALLGSAPGVAAAAAKTIRALHPAISIVFAESGGVVSDSQPEVSADQLALIHEYKPDILFVGFGAPKQELWMQAAGELHVPTMIGVGGTFNFYAGRKRAPEFVRTAHMEWLYRGLTEPGHWKRLITATLVFPVRTLAWRVAGGSVAQIDQ